MTDNRLILQSNNIVEVTHDNIETKLNLFILFYFIPNALNKGQKKERKRGSKAQGKDWVRESLVRKMRTGSVHGHRRRVALGCCLWTQDGRKSEAGRVLWIRCCGIQELYMPISMGKRLIGTKVDTAIRK